MADRVRSRDEFSDGTMTSCPGRQPTASSARWSAAVPFETAIACRHVQSAAKASSNSSTVGPMLHHPEETTSLRALRISSSTRRSASGTLHLGWTVWWAPRFKGSMSSRTARGRCPKRHPYEQPGAAQALRITSAGRCGRRHSWRGSTRTWTNTFTDPSAHIPSSAALHLTTWESMRGQH